MSGSLVELTLCFAHFSFLKFDLFFESSLLTPLFTIPHIVHLSHVVHLLFCGLSFVTCIIIPWHAMLIFNFNSCQLLPWHSNSVYMYM